METTVKVLILEHDSNDLGLLQYELKKSGMNYTAQVVQTKQDYEATLSSFQPDIILSDYSLPSFDGLSAFHIKQSLTPDTPFIIVSGTLGEEKAVDLIKLGITDFALKDKLFQISTKIQRALNETADRRQRETAELQLRLREEQLQKIMNLSLDMICTLDERGNFVTVSAASKDILGYEPNELIGTRAVLFAHEEDKETTISAGIEFRKGQDLINFENRYIHKNGRIVYLSWSARWDPKENLGYCVARDVTSIKQAEEKVRNSEKRFRTLIQNSSEGLALLAADGTVVERSPAAIRILGLKPNEVSGKFRIDLVHPNDLPIVNNACSYIKDKPNATLTVEYRFCMPDGKYKWIETTLQNQLHEPAIKAIVLNFRDITERKLSEIALRESEAKLKEAQAVAHLGNWELYWGGESAVWSDEIYRIFETKKETIQPSFAALMSFVHPDDQGVVQAKFDKITATPENGNLEFRLLRSNSEIRYVITEWRIKFNDAGEPISLFGILQDITERKLIKMALEKSEQKYRDLFNLSPIPMWLFDVKTLRFLDVNEAAITHYGYSREEFLLMNLKDIRPKEEISKLEAAIGAYANSKLNYHDLTRHTKKDGEVIEVDIKNSALEIDGKEVRLVLATDVSERIKHTQAIEEQNIKLREITWIQSHVVRAPLARMMGLVNLLDNNATKENDKTEVLHYLKTSANELDNIIRDIVSKAEQVQSYTTPSEAASE